MLLSLVRIVAVEEIWLATKIDPQGAIVIFGAARGAMENKTDWQVCYGNV